MSPLLLLLLLLLLLFIIIDEQTTFEIFVSDCMRFICSFRYCPAISIVIPKHLTTECSTFQLSNSFKTWSQLFQRRVRNLDLLESFLERKQTELLQSFTLRWRKDTLKCRATESFVTEGFEQKSFAKWWFRLYTKKGLESVREVQ